MFSGSSIIFSIAIHGQPTHPELVGQSKWIWFRWILSWLEQTMKAPAEVERYMLSKRVRGVWNILWPRFSKNILLVDDRCGGGFMTAKACTMLLNHHLSSGCKIPQLCSNSSVHAVVYLSSMQILTSRLDIVEMLRCREQHNGIWRGCIK